MIREISSDWFETKVRYNKEVDGEYKKVTEIYVVDAISFTESETRITDEMAKYISGEYSVVDIKKAPYKEILFDDDDNASFWYRAKVGFITVDEKTEKEKIQNVVYLVQAESLKHAVRSLEDNLGGMSTDYVITEVKETKIVDVIEHSEFK